MKQNERVSEHASLAKAEQRLPCGHDHLTSDSDSFIFWNVYRTAADRVTCSLISKTLEPDKHMFIKLLFGGPRGVHSMLCSW